MPQAYEATRRALHGGYRQRVAVRIGVSDSTVEAWCVPPKSLDGNGIPCPAQRFITMQLELVAAGHPDPFYLLHYACRELGFLPPVRNEASVDPCSIDFVAKATKEFGELLVAVGEASADGIISAADADRILDEGDHVVGAMAPLLRFLHSVEVAEEESLVRKRRGPKRVPRLMELRRLA